MMNVLLWIIGVVFNYNTRTRHVNRFPHRRAPTDGIPGTKLRDKSRCINKSIRYVSFVRLFIACGVTKASIASDRTMRRRFWSAVADRLQGTSKKSVTAKARFFEIPFRDQEFVGEGGIALADPSKIRIAPKEGLNKPSSSFQLALG